jgi:ubiquinone/menaquinone biosynthesis C-methylase UbiE
MGLTAHGGQMSTDADENRTMDAAPQSTIRDLFDAMADEYDVLEPWYEHLYARLHTLLVAHLAPAVSSPQALAGVALDAGCGHGAQTALLRSIGYQTHGVDISGRLLALARRRLPDVALAHADLAALPYADASFDAVSCAGSTLSFVADPDAVLRELSRVLRPGARLFLECEHKWSLDLAWTLASALTRDAFGYGVAVSTLARALRAPLHASVRLPYPGYGTLTLFSGRDLRRRLAAVGLRWEQAWGIHAVTNVIPSPILHRAHLSRPLAAVYRVLCRLDTRTSGAAPLRAFANSLVVLAVRA